MIGMTVECPDDIWFPPYTLGDCRDSSNYWVLEHSTVHHHGRGKQVQIDTWNLKVGDTIALSVDSNGTLYSYVNGINREVCWDKLPTNQAMYGVVDIWTRHNKIRSLFHYGKYTSVLT